MPLDSFRAAALAFGLASLATPAAAAIPLDKAAALFAEAKVICERDAGALWGRSLCGPILLVDADDRSVVANQADAAGALKPSGAVFVGVFPRSENLANTPVEWSGTRWSELIWQLLPEDTTQRHAMLAHELFHRIQPDVALAQPKGGDNTHLDTLEGRYLLQLELRALGAALQASTPPARNAAIADALLFRAQRYALFPDAAANERALELGEGVPQYTGARLGLTTPQARTAFAIDSLKPYSPDATFVRSFAYSTGAAYGLLLDQVDPAWRGKLASGPRFDELLRPALRLPASNLATLKARAAVYDDGALRTAEVARDKAMQTRAATQKASLVDGPILVLPLKKMNYQFNPQSLQALAPYGTVYPTLRLTDEWGVIEVEAGALMADDKKTLAVSANAIDTAAAKGPGWRLTLKPGWTLTPGPRKGDFALAPPASP